MQLVKEVRMNVMEKPLGGYASEEIAVNPAHISLVRRFDGGNIGRDMTGTPCVELVLVCGRTVIVLGKVVDFVPSAAPEAGDRFESCIQDDPGQPPDL